MTAKTSPAPLNAIEDISFRDMPDTPWERPQLDSLPELPLLEVRGLGFSYQRPGRWPWSKAQLVPVLHDIQLTLATGRSVGIVGASGSGKSTLARLLVALAPPTSGTVRLLGRNLHSLAPDALRKMQQEMHWLTQDAHSTLDPQQCIEQLITEPLRHSGQASALPLPERAARALHQVGLHRSDLARYPQEFSAGQRQRIALARALIAPPALLVADEPFSALDMSVQAQMLQFMLEQQAQHGIGYVLISHDLAVVQHLCDEVVVLDQGRVVEHGTPQILFSQPQHPCTQALVDALPQIDPGRARRRQALRADIAKAQQSRA